MTQSAERTKAAPRALNNFDQPQFSVNTVPVSSVLIGVKRITATKIAE
jgi:hypothetical protein